jgi:hypothetical protein
MFALIHEQLYEISKTTRMLNEKKNTCMNRMSYIRALQLFYMTLRKTNNELSDIYFNYALKPQVRLTQPIVVYCVWCMHHLLKKQYVHN